MNTDPTIPGPSLHIPFAILAVAIAVLLGAQIGASKKSAEIMAWQRDTIEKQISTMQTTDKQFGEAIVRRETLVQQSGELKKQLEALLNDLLELARDDADAKQIVTKYNVQRAAAPAAGEQSAGAAGEKAP